MSFGWDPPPRIVGHRGAPREATENTLASFEACLRDGVRAVELDARLAADGQVVVHHDAELGRAIPGTGRVEEIASDALRAKGVPLLSDVLALGLLVDVEIKADADRAAALPAAVLDVVRRADALDRVLVTSFAPELADEYARLAGRPAGAILPFVPEREDLEAWPRLRYVMLAEDAALPEAIELCRATGREVLVWTVNDEAGARALLARGAAGIVTDRPGPLARSIGGGATARSPPRGASS